MIEPVGRNYRKEKGKTRIYGGDGTKRSVYFQQLVELFSSPQKRKPHL